MTLNYFVVIQGHIAWFEQHEAACDYRKEFGGSIFCLVGLLLARSARDIPVSMNPI
jgi:hypothetical protein